MKIYDRYEDYVAAFSDMSGPQPVYAAEALSDLYIDDASADGSEFCFLWKTADGFETATVKADGRLRKVLSVFRVTVSREENDCLWKALYDESARRWLNMCHFRKDKTVAYDSYYDRLPAYDSETAPSIPALHKAVAEWLSANLQLDGSVTLCVFGDLASDNVLQYVAKSVLNTPVTALEGSFDALEYERDCSRLDLSEMALRPGETKRFLLEERAEGAVFGQFNVCEIVDGHKPDIRFGGISAYALELTSRADMMGNSSLSVKFADGTEKTLFNVKKTF